MITVQANDIRNTKPSRPFMWKHPIGTVWLRTGAIDVCLIPAGSIFSIGEVTPAATCLETAWSWRIDYRVTLVNSI